MSTLTTVLQLLNGTVAGDIPQAADWNAITDELELLEVHGLGQLVGAGVLAVADFALSIGAGTSVDVSAGRAWVGDTGERRVVRKTGSTNVTGLTTATTWYVFLNRDGTFTAQTSATAPANAILVGSAVSTGAAITSVNSGPAGRVNLVPLFREVVTKTAAYTATDADEVVLANAAGGAFSVGLPTAVGRRGWRFTVKRTSASNNVTVDPAGAETIDAAATKILGSQHAFITVISDGAGWQIIATGGTVT